MATQKSKIYRISVINKSGVKIYDNPSTSSKKVGSKKKGDIFQSDSTKSSGGITWYRIKGTTNWIPGTSSNGKTTNVKILSQSDSTASKVDSNTKSTKKKGETKKVTKYDVGATFIDDGVNTDKLGIPSTTKSTRLDDTGGISEVDKVYNTTYLDDYMKFNIYEDGTSVYPMSESTESIVDRNRRGHANVLRNGNGDIINIIHGDNDKVDVGQYNPNTQYNYSIIINDSTQNKIDSIRRQLCLPSLYDRNNLNKKIHVKFNRYKYEYPDLYLRNARGVVIFTRPDLNLYNSSHKILAQVKRNERAYGILKRDGMLGKLLTASGKNDSYLRYHNFNPLLSNLAQGIEVQDDSVDTLETGETFSGYKMQYAKHNIRSITAGNLSIKFKETYELAVTCLHQLWVDYESEVYRGTMVPTDEHIWNRELDYACNIYYFLLDTDGETIRFWTKYYGCFPVNVPKSSFSYEYGSELSFPDVSVTYNYIHKSDLSVRTLVEFNQDGGNSKLPYNYAGIFNHNTGLPGETWVGIPYIESSNVNNGIQSNSLTYKLKFRKNIKATTTTTTKNETAEKATD